MKKLCVYCGSSSGRKPSYSQAAQDLGQSLARRHVGLVYGGANCGLMGEIASSCLAAGGHVVGIVPRGVLEDESAHSELSELRMVDSMHERKQLMADQADAFLALPGGIGTLEELFEIWTWAQLGLHAKPIGLLNVEGYYDDLLSFVRGASREGFVRHTTEQKLTVGIDVESLLAQLGL